jgi:hypothetical protein
MLVHVNDSKKNSGSEITPSATYFNRRNFIRTGILAASAAATGLVYRQLNHARSIPPGSRE